MGYLIYPICEKKRLRKNEGTSKIYLQYNYSSNLRPLLDTDLAIPPQFWNKKTRRIINKLPPEYGDYRQLNSELIRQEQLAQDLIRLAVRMKVADIMAFMKEYYSPKLDITELTGKKDLFERLAKPPEERTNLDLFFQLEEGP